MKELMIDWNISRPLEHPELSFKSILDLLLLVCDLPLCSRWCLGAIPLFEVDPLSVEYSNQKGSRGKLMI